MMVKSDESQDETLDSNGARKDLPRQSFDYDALKMYWRRYAQLMKEARKSTFYNAMIKRDPQLNNETAIVMEVDNQVQVDYITPTVSELVGYLRKELKNYDISFEIILSTNQETDTRYKTGKDKFTSLAQKNPNLNTLKNTFNLDIEY